MGKKLNHQHLPLEITHNILLDLPVKSLSRFRCVSNPWRSLISDPGFQDDYHRRSQQNPLLLITRSEQEHNILHLSTYREGTLVNNFSITLPGPFPHDDYHLGYASCFTVVQSCQGLVCLSDYFKEHILVCSPSTGELIRLPETFCSSHCIGFGYTGKEFKVVRFFSFPFRGRGSRDNCCEIFTLGSSEWISARSPCLWYLEKYMSGAPFLHGAFHLLPNTYSYDGEDYSYGGEDDIIVVFNIETERYSKMLLPEYYYTLSEISSPSWQHIELKELRGSLCLTFFSNTSLELWFLKDYDRGAWMKEYTIDLASSSVGFHLAEPLLIMHNGSMLLTVVAEDESVSLYCYNPNDNTLTQWTKEKCSATLYAESFLTMGKNHHVE